MMLDLPINAVPLAFLDFETTGLFPQRGDRVCEVAVQRVVGDTVALTYSTLVNPQRPLSARSFAINRIGAELLAAAPTFAEVAEPLRAALAGAAIVAHNAPFDLEFLHAELAQAGFSPMNPLAIDTLALARQLYPRRPSHSLAALTGALGLSTPTHRALDDVLALRAVFADMQERLAEQNVTSLGALLRYTRGFAPDAPEPPIPEPLASALRDGRLLRIVYRSRTSAEPIERVVRPIEVISQRGVVFLRAYCYLREDLRVFLVEKISGFEVIGDE
jgi:DNA polymerase-3 subunit epsilon